MDALHLQYLEAMRVPVWVLRKPLAAVQGQSPRLHLGPGNGALLLVCGEPGESATMLAADLARALPEPPVWAWPEAGEGGCLLGEAVRDRLLTGIAVCGQDVARSLFTGEPPSAMGSARVVVLPSMARLSADPDARRDCWRALLSAGMVRPR